MRSALDGDSGAYRRLFVSLAPFLRAMTRRNGARIGIRHDETEDVVQEILLALHLKRHTWDLERPIGPWIMAIARNKLIDARRRRGNRVFVQINEFSEFPADDKDGDPAARSDIDRLLEKLTDKQRDLVRSLSIEGRSVEETARRLNMKEGAVRVALHRAIKALAALYRNSDQ
ncbi:sigma-70 family RNA polymerase sigma factor [Methylocystis parvus OBBP]|nr:sigma-70 family RNA polymerase sigma factor [Methylocystis parvus]WBK02082.1 sigma-70 family RNA polymerase sigma factor [Methylocystis parvus OBBP]